MNSALTGRRGAGAWVRRAYPELVYPRCGGRWCPSVPPTQLGRLVNTWASLISRPPDHLPNQLPGASGLSIWSPDVSLLSVAGPGPTVLLSFPTCSSSRMTWLWATSPGAQGLGGRRAAMETRTCPGWSSCSAGPQPPPVTLWAGSICVTESAPSKSLAASDSDSLPGAGLSGQDEARRPPGVGGGASRWRALPLETEGAEDSSRAE